MPSDQPPLPAAELLAPSLPTGSLQEAWQDIVRRQDQAHDWYTLELRTEHAYGWTAALIQAQVIDHDTYRALVQVREQVHARVTRRLGLAP